jgi:DnaJ-class molecular chaperone
MLTRTKIVICPECHGHGEVRVCNLRENHNLDLEKCGQCNGSGKLKRIVTIKFEQV